MKRVFIVGAIGFGKMSDECMMHQMMFNVRQDHPDTHVGVLSGQPGQTAKLGVEAVPRHDVKAMWEAVEDSDTVVWLWSEHVTDWRTFGLELLLVRLAKWRNKHLVVYRPAAGPQPAGWLAGPARRVCSKSDETYVYGLTDDVHPHPLVAVRPSRRDGLRLLQEEGIYTSQRPVAWCIDHKTVSQRTRDVASLADELVDEGTHLVFLPVDHFDDMEAANHVLDHMRHAVPVVRKMYPPQQWIDILADMHAVVTTYDAVQALCSGLDVPCVRLNEETTVNDIDRLRQGVNE